MLTDLQKSKLSHFFELLDYNHDTKSILVAIDLALNTQDHFIIEKNSLIHNEIKGILKNYKDIENGSE